MIKIQELRRRDYKKARQFAVQGMHLYWYVRQDKSEFICQILLGYRVEQCHKSLRSICGWQIRGRSAGRYEGRAEEIPQYLAVSVMSFIIYGGVSGEVMKAARF